MIRSADPRSEDDALGEDALASFRKLADPQAERGQP